MKNYYKTLLVGGPNNKTIGFVSSNNKNDFHKGYRLLYKLGYRRVDSYYVNLLFYKEYWVKMERNF